jgi:hypothetical protein
MLMLDIPYEELLKAVTEIQKKRGICDHPPMARFYIGPYSRSEDPAFEGLICDERGTKMQGRATGTAARGCTNCLVSGRGSPNGKEDW